MFNESIIGDRLLASRAPQLWSLCLGGEVVAQGRDPEFKASGTDVHRTTGVTRSSALPRDTLGLYRSRTDPGGIL